MKKNILSDRNILFLLIVLTFLSPIVVETDYGEGTLFFAFLNFFGRAIGLFSFLSFFLGLLLFLFEIIFGRSEKDKRVARKMINWGMILMSAFVLPYVIFFSQSISWGL
ncbi:MAG: hypothetical protein WC180_02230 [Candidatus Paceibacterota bacterium]